MSRSRNAFFLEHTYSKYTLEANGCNISKMRSCKIRNAQISTSATRFITLLRRGKSVDLGLQPQFPQVELNIWIDSSQTGQRQAIRSNMWLSSIKDENSYPSSRVSADILLLSKSKLARLTDELVQECAGWDPLSITTAQARNSDILNSMLCASQNHRRDCNCLALRQIYGSRIFKCDRPGCLYFRTGFPTRKERDRHSAAHSRSFKCPITSCDFAEVGFITQSRLSTHLIEIHDLKAIPSLRTPSHRDLDAGPELHGVTTVDSGVAQRTSSTKRVKRLLVEAVKSNNFDYVDKYGRFVTKHLCRLLRICVQFSSMDMLDLLLKQCAEPEESFQGLEYEDPPPDIPARTLMAVDRYILNYASRFDKVPAARRLIEKGARPWDHNTRNRHSDMYYAIYNRSPDMIALLLKHGSRDVADGFGRLIPGQKDIAAENAALQCFELLDEACLLRSEQHIRTCFKMNAEIAQFLLGKGAGIDDCESSGYTALYWASGNKSEKAAKFMEFLLRSGANPPENVHRLLPISERPGPRIISRWLGVSWSELVDHYRVGLVDLDGSSDSMDSIDL